MNVLITGAASPLGQQIVAELDSNHQLRLLDNTTPDIKYENFEFIQGSLVDPSIASEATQNIDVLIHTGEPPPNLPQDPLECEQVLLDLATRGTHVLFKAAVDTGVKRFIYGSTLEIFGSYPDDTYISEFYKPLPTPEIYQMARYLGELTCREFARTYMITVTSLRLGRLVLEEDVADRDLDLMWLDLRDAARAFAGALKRDQSSSVQWTQRWAVYHIGAPIKNPKFLISGASQIGYQPQHNFQSDKRIP